MRAFPCRRAAPPCGTVLEPGRPPNEIPTMASDRSPGPLVSLRDKEPDLDGSPRPAFSAAGATLITAGSGLVLVTVGKAARSPARCETRASLSLSPVLPVGPSDSHQPAQADAATQFLFPGQPPQSIACAHLRRRAGKRRPSTRCGRAPAAGPRRCGPPAVALQLGANQSGSTVRAATVREPANVCPASRPRRGSPLSGGQPRPGRARVRRAARSRWCTADRAQPARAESRPSSNRGHPLRGPATRPPPCPTA